MQPSFPGTFSLLGQRKRYKKDTRTAQVSTWCIRSACPWGCKSRSWHRCGFSLALTSKWRLKGHPDQQMKLNKVSQCLSWCDGHRGDVMEGGWAASSGKPSRQSGLPWQRRQHRPGSLHLANALPRPSAHACIQNPLSKPPSLLFIVSQRERASSTRRAPSTAESNSRSQSFLINHTVHRLNKAYIPKHPW